MRRMSRSISLVLIGSSMFLAGCGEDNKKKCEKADPADPTKPVDCTNSSKGGSTTHTRSSHFVPVPIGGGGGSTRTSTPSSTPATKSGFGSTGHATGSSSTGS